MKLLVIGTKERYMKFIPEDLPITKEVEMVFVERGASEEEILEAGKDATFMAVDAISEVKGSTMEQMSNLKIIHSEGVAFNRIDLQKAKELGIYVCNSKGMNAKAVGEHAVLLILSCLRNLIQLDEEIRAGNQIQVKEKAMVEGIREIADCKVGLIGFGDIAKEVARKLIPFDTEVYYTDLFQASKDVEEQYHVTYKTQEEILKECDIISLHVPVTKATERMVNSEFLSKMKKEAILINTARGDLVDNTDLKEALDQGIIGMAGLDTLDPEPVPANHILLSSKRVVLSPHIAGVTTSSFRRSHRMIWQSFEDVRNGKRPQYIVNKL